MGEVERRGDEQREDRGGVDVPDERADGYPLVAQDRAAAHQPA
ncbi:hypothetical protein [Streptomyces halstedii]